MTDSKINLRDEADGEACKEERVAAYVRTVSVDCCFHRARHGDFCTLSEGHREYCRWRRLFENRRISNWKVDCRLKYRCQSTRSGSTAGRVLVGVMAAMFNLPINGQTIRQILDSDIYEAKKS